MKFSQHKYELTDISYLDDIVIPKKVTTSEDVKATVDNLHETSNSKRAGYMKRFFIITTYIMEFQALNGIRIEELLAILLNNIDFDKKTLEIDGSIHWRNKNNSVSFEDADKTESSYKSMSLITRSCDILRKIMLENKKAIQWETMY